MPALRPLHTYRGGFLHFLCIILHSSHRVGSPNCSTMGPSTYHFVIHCIWTGSPNCSAMGPSTYYSSFCIRASTPKLLGDGSVNLSFCMQVGSPNCSAISPSTYHPALFLHYPITFPTGIACRTVIPYIHFTASGLVPLTTRLTNPLVLSPPCILMPWELRLSPGIVHRYQGQLYFATPWYPISICIRIDIPNYYGSVYGPLPHLQAGYSRCIHGYKSSHLSPPLLPD